MGLRGETGSMAQMKNSFDKESLTKVGKGALIAATAAAALYILSFVGVLEIENPVLASVIAWFVPFVTNLVREWRKGEAFNE